jgi:hypothetical protein
MVVAFFEKWRAVGRQPSVYRCLSFHKDEGLFEDVASSELVHHS